MLKPLLLDFDRGSQVFICMDLLCALARLQQGRSNLFSRASYFLMKGEFLLLFVHLFCQRGRWAVILETKFTEHAMKPRPHVYTYSL